MGCVVDKSSALEVLSKISDQKARLSDLESKLLKSDMELVSIPQEKIDLELRKSSQNLKILSEYFKIMPSPSYQEKLKNMSQAAHSSKAYIALRLESSDHEYRISENFSELMDHLKELDVKMCQKINSKSISLSIILSQGQYSALLSDLQKVKDDQIILSSFRGGSFEEIVTRVSKRYDMDKELEIIQTKLENQQYFNSLNSEDAESKSLQVQITELRNTRSDLERAWDMVRLNTKNNDQEISTLQFEHEQILPVVQDLEKKVEALENTQNDLETRMQGILDLQKQIQEIDEKREKVEHEKDDLEKLYQDLVKRLETTNQYKNEIEKLSNTKDLLAMQAEKLDIQCEDPEKNVEIDEKKQKKLADLESELCRLGNMSLELSEQIKVKENECSTTLKKFIVMRLKSAFHEILRKSFQSWKLFNLKEETSVISSIGQVSLSGLHEDEGLELIDSDIRETNAIFTTIRGANEKPMSTVNLFKFLEELMDKKVETDEKDIKEKRKPRSMAEFMQEHLSRVFGIPKIANRQLAQIIPALQELYEQQDPYGSIFCRLLGIFDMNPLPLHFAVYLASARSKFMVLNEKYEKSSLITQNRRSSRNKKDMIDEAKSGGLAQANDVIDLIVNIFENYRNLGTLALKLLRPAEICVEDFVVFQICQKIVRLGRSIEGVFNIIDKDASLSVDIKELSQFSKSNIDLWVDENDLELCFAKIATPGTQEIAKEVFMNRFSIKNFQELARNKNYVISKAKFLSTLVEVFNEIQRKQRENIARILNGFKDPVNKEEFKTIFRLVDPELEGKTERFYHEIRDSHEMVSHENIQKLFLKYCLGEHRRGPFGLEILNDLREEKRIRTAVSLEENFLVRERAKTTGK
jgi:hypothetical protein